MRHCITSLALLTLTLGLAGAQTPAKLEEAVLVASNAHRAKNDKGKLRIDATLNKIAQAHAQAMARRNLYGDGDKNGHYLDGKGPVDRAKAGGYKYAELLENVGWNTGHKDP